MLMMNSDVGVALLKTRQGDRTTDTRIHKAEQRQSFNTMQPEISSECMMGLPSHSQNQNQPCKKTEGCVRHQSESSWLLPNMVHSPSKVASVVRTEAKCSVIVRGAGPGMKILHGSQFRMADFFHTVEVCAQSRTLLVPELGRTNFWATKQFPYSSRLFRMTQRRGRCSSCRRTPLNSTHF